MTTTTSTPSSSIAPPISSFDPQLLKLLARHHHHYNQQPSAKEFLQHAFYFNHPPPNTVATLSPRHHLSNGLSKLNTENSTSNTKLSSITTTTNGKLDQQQTISPNNTQIKKPIIQQQQVKDALAFDQWLQPPLGSIIQGPPCLQPDTSSSSSSSSSSTSSATAGSKCETTLSSGERITCFVVGGEKRLCLPEILNTVLKDFSLQEINAACERLHIYCSRCTNEQLDTLKKTQVLPMNAPSCGLITQTDAERLCANLLQLHYKGQLHTINSATTNPYERLYSIKVQHKCFGKCSGTLYPTLYIAAQAECIQCDTCQALFSPKTFVSHGHKSEENRICHWGFNSDNWRSYLKIRSTEDMKAREEMELFKEKFLHSHSTINQKKRLTQQQDCLVSTEKRLKLAPSSSTDAWPYPYNQSNYISMKKDNHGEYSFGACLPRPSLIAPPLPLALPIETTTTTATASNSCPRPSPLRVVQSNSPVPNERPTPSITNFNDFSPDGIRQIVESTVSSPRSRQQLITYISQLQLHTYTQSSRTNSTVGDTHQQNEIVLLRRENELLRERLSKIENNQISSNSSTISNGSKFSSNDNNPQHDSIAGDSDDLDSNVSSHSVSSSLVAHETTNEQPKYFDRKRRLLAAEQQISTSETDTLVIKKSSPHKKACLDDIVDTLNQKAQAEKYEEDEQDENVINELEIKQEQNDDDDDDDEEEEEEEELLDETNNNNNNNNNSEPSSTTTTEIEDEEEEEKEEGEAEEDEEDIDVDGVKLTIDDHH